MAHLFANILPAVCTLLSAFDDWVLGEGTPCLCEKIQNNTKRDKANNMIDEGTAGDKREKVDPHCTTRWRSPPSHCHSPIFCCLLESIIGIVWSLSQHEERFFQIPVDKRQQRDGGQDDVRHEGLNDVSEPARDSGIMMLDE